jgi:5-methylthioadenosine/S-adenosylhomocysteine deaminase
LEKTDILICNCVVLTMDDESTYLENGTIAVAGDRIVSVGPVAEMEQQFVSDRTIQAKGMLAMPGLVNTHTHAPMVYFRGLADDLPLKEWLEKHIWPAEAKYVSPSFVREAVKLAAVEMIKSGTTVFCDMYFAEDEAANSLKEIGMRAVLGEGLLDFPTPISKNPEEGLKNSENFIKKWLEDELIVPAVAPHAPYTCSPGLLKDAKKLADKYSLPLHIHLAEENWEVEQIRKEKGMSPVEYLESLGFLDERTSAAHVNWVTEKDIRILAETRTGVCHNPQSNMKLATGVCPVADLLGAGVKVGLGTDGASSNNDLDMFGEMLTASILQKAFKKDPTVLKAREVVAMATRGGAAVLGLEKDIGSLEAGKKADLILIDLNQPHLVPMYDVYSHLVYAVNSTDVDTTIINGQVVMQNRKLMTADEKQIVHQAKAFASKLISES